MPRKKRPVAPDTPKLRAQILDLFADGKLIIETCKMAGIPTKKLQHMRRDDLDFDAQCWSSQAQGLLIQHDHLVVAMRKAGEQNGVGSGNRVMALRELLNDWKFVAGKLVSRLKDRVELAGPAGHITISWANEPEPTGPVIEHQPTGRELLVEKPGAANGAGHG